MVLERKPGEAVQRGMPEVGLLTSAAPGSGAKLLPAGPGAKPSGAASSAAASSLSAPASSSVASSSAGYNYFVLVRLVVCGCWLWFSGRRVMGGDASHPYPHLPRRNGRNINVFPADQVYQFKPVIRCGGVEVWRCGCMRCGVISSHKRKVLRKE